jgi:hypothetical protein
MLSGYSRFGIDCRHDTSLSLGKSPSLGGRMRHTATLLNWDDFLRTSGYVASGLTIGPREIGLKLARTRPVMEIDITR